MDLQGRNKKKLIFVARVLCGEIFRRKYHQVFSKVLFRALLYPGWSVFSMSSMALLLESHSRNVAGATLIKPTRHRRSAVPLERIPVAAHSRAIETLFLRLSSNKLGIVVLN